MIGTCIGSYCITKLLGEGGMGAVYQATHTVLGRSAAVKVMRADLCGVPEQLQRFFNEARAASAVSHPGLVSVFDVGQLADGRAYLVMEFLAGESLAERLARRRPAPLEKALGIARQVAVALTEVHRRGIVHRDLKPDNLMLVPDPETAIGLRVKIVDFGIAKLAPALVPGYETRKDLMMGTPRYMGPEQFHSAALATDRADVYALGIILYEMLAGTPPFVAESLPALLDQHENAAPAPLHLLNPAVPAEVEALVFALLAKQPQGRPSMAQVQQQLTGLAAMPLTAPVPRMSVPRLTPLPRSAASMATPAPAPGTTVATVPGIVRVAGLSAVVGVAVTAVALAAVLLISGRTTPPPPPPMVAQPAVAVDLRRPADLAPPADLTPPARAPGGRATLDGGRPDSAAAPQPRRRKANKDNGGRNEEDRVVP